MRKHEVKYANLIVKIGDKNLVDYLNSIVLPSITNEKIFRKHGDTSYHILGARVERLGGPDGDICLFGRFVKNTVLRRTQVLKGGQLEHSVRQMESAPSAFFLLRIQGHRLAYFAETAHAPPIETFEASLKYQLRKGWELMINEMYQDRSEGVTKASLIKAHPRPTVVLSTMVSGDSLDKFIKRFSIIRKIEVTVHERNDEYEAGETVEAIDELRKRLKGKKAKFETQSNEGLDASQTKEAVVDMGKTGNQSIKLTGKDQDGDRLVGNPDDFSVSDQMERPPRQPKSIANRLIKMLLEAGLSGRINLGSDSAETRRAVEQAILDGE